MTTLLGVPSYAPESVDHKMFHTMPADYREHVIRLMAIQAYGEKMACVLGRDWIARAPGFRERRVYTDILADEARHSALLFRELERLGIAEAKAIDIAAATAGSRSIMQSLEGPNAVGDAENDWLDIVCNLMFLDRAGRVMIENYAQSSYRPWARACQKILPDEAMHENFGVIQFRSALNAGANRDMLAARATRWYAYSLNFFGPPSSHKYDVLRDFGIKRRNNEELRQAYQAECIALMNEMGAGDLLRLSSESYPFA